MSCWMGSSLVLVSGEHFLTDTSEAVVAHSLQDCKSGVCLHSIVLELYFCCVLIV